MFKKSNRNFRSKRTEIESDEENEDTKLEPHTIVLKSSKDELRDSEKVIQEVKNTKLSFGDEEDSEEFKVKKSRESRRIAKELKKSKKEKEKQPNTEEQSESKNFIKMELIDTSNEIRFNDEIRIKPLQKNEKNISKYIKNKYLNEDYKSDEEFNSYKIESDDEKIEKDQEEEETDKLKRLREEFEILTGEDLDPVEHETDETKRSMKLMLKSGIIPDANLIHEARKKREMARQGDYIPIGQTVSKGKSTLVREDDEDLSEDEHGVTQTQSRLTMNYKEASYKERQTTRDNFLVYEQGSDDDIKSDFSEDELEKWEKEQIKKGVQISQLSSNDFKDMKKAKFIEKLLGSNLESEPMDIESNYENDFNSDKLNNMPQISFLSIKESLKSSLSGLEDTHRVHMNEYNMTIENLNANKTDLENLKNSKPSLDEQYIYYQEMKAYLTDFIDCFNEKMPELEKGEQTWLDFYKERSSKVLKRRIENLRDQSAEASASISKNKKTFEEQHLQRMNEREKRRSNRKILKEQKSISNMSFVDTIELNEGFSTDDDDLDENSLKQNVDDVLKETNQKIFADILEEFYNFDLIKHRFEKWKKLNEQNYKNAYVLLSLPKLFSPLIRAELIDWNPLEQNDDNYLEKTKWFTSLLSYNQKDLDKNDDDFMLIPYIIEKIIINKLISITEWLYDPFSTKQSKRFSNLVLNMIKSFPTLNSQSLNSKKLIETLIARFKKTLEEEVFVPLYSKQLIQQRESEPSKFFYRQFYSCIKVFSNILLWKDILSDSVLKELTIDCLLNRYLLIGLQNMNSNIETILLIEYIVSKLPKNWLNINIESTNTMDLPQIASLIRLVRRISDQIYESEFKSNKIDSKEFQSQVKIIRKLFQTMGASDQAISLSNAYQF